jgi:hypothetical protein
MTKCQALQHHTEWYLATIPQKQVEIITYIHYPPLLLSFCVSTIKKNVLTKNKKYIMHPPQNEQNGQEEEKQEYDDSNNNVLTKEINAWKSHLLYKDIPIMRSIP